MSDGAKNLTDVPGVGGLQAYAFHSPSKGTLQGRNRTMARETACFMVAGDSDWNGRVVLACFRYNTRVCAATGMASFEAVFGIETFQAWNDIDAACFDDKPDILAKRLALLHRQIYSRSRESLARAKREYDKRVSRIEFPIGGKVLL